MKKIIITLLTVVLLTPIIGVLDSRKAKADDYYSYSCSYSEYEVDYINDDGSFSNKGCYSDFSAAKQAMKDLGGDHVVRHATSLSPTKIVAMNSGLVYSYPGRSGTNTMKIYQNASERSVYYKDTYVANHYEMHYVDTERYLPKYNGGIVEVIINGFSGFADLEYTDLVPSKYLDNGIGLYLGGNNNYDGESPFYIIPTRNYYETVKNGNYVDLAFHYSRAYPENNNKPRQYTIYIGKAPDFMEQGTKYYSADGVNFYTDSNLKNHVGTYYNYYQFLPLRSKTSITAETLESYLNSTRSGSVMSGHCVDFINEQEQYGVNGLLLFAMACHESSYGTSGYAKQRNNLFGWNAVDADPGKASYFASVSACINEQAGINLRGYLDITDGRFFSTSLGNKGSGLNVKYASDPYWSMDIASIAYSIDKYSKGKDGTYTDYNKETLALIDSFDVAAKKSASDSADNLYTTAYGPYYQKDFIVIELGNEGSYTKIQSTNGIDTNGNLITHRTPVTTGELNPISTYDFSRSVAYIRSSYLKQLNNIVVPINNDPLPENLEVYSSVDDIRIDGSNLYIEGSAFIKGMNFVDTNDITHTVMLKNIADSSVAKSYVANTIEYQGVSFNDDYTYKYVGYNALIPLSDMAVGSYYLSINVKNRNASFDSKLSSYSTAASNINASVDNKNYHLFANRLYAYRLELDVCSLPSDINYASVSKPSIRPSLFSFDEINIDDNGVFNIYGQGFIYYVDFNSKDNIKYSIYLLKDASTYDKIDCETLESNADYASLLGLEESLDYVCFAGNKSLKDLPAGKYTMLMKIVNGNSVDYVEMTDATGMFNVEKVLSGTSYKIYASDIRNRLILEVSK